MTITKPKKRNQVHLVGLERLRSEFDRIRALKQDPFELKKGRGVHDDDSTAMTEATMSIASNGSSEDSTSSTSSDEEQLPVHLQRLHQSRPDHLHGDTASYVTPQVSNKAKKKKSPARSMAKIVNVEDKTDDARENSTSSGSFFEELNDCLMSCFSCTNSYTPPASTFLHYNNIPAPEPERSNMKEDDPFTPHHVRRIPFANRLG